MQSPEGLSQLDSLQDCSLFFPPKKLTPVQRVEVGGELRGESVAGIQVSKVRVKQGFHRLWSLRQSSLASPLPQGVVS